MKLRRTAGLLLSIAAAATMMLISAPPSQADTYLGNVVIRNVDSHLCVSLNPQTLDKDVQVVQEPCDYQFDTPQSWRVLLAGFQDNDPNFPIYRLQNEKTGMCLRAVSNRDFSVVDTIDCTSISNEKWALNLSGTTEIASLISSGGYPLLDVFEDLPNPGNTLDVFHYDGTGAQFFEIVHL
jgi:hypothetical protein